MNYPYQIEILEHLNYSFVFCKFYLKMGKVQIRNVVAVRF